MSTKVSKPFIIIGAGGHAKVVIDLLQTLGHEIKGIVDTNEEIHGSDILGVKILGSDEIIEDFGPNEVHLAIGVGAIASRDQTGLDIRTRIYNEWHKKGYNISALIHPAAIVSEHAEIQSGAQIMAGVVVQPASIIGENVILNTRCSVDHDSIIGAHSHIAPNATICGAVTIGNGVYVGANATIFQGIKSPDDIVIPGGSVIRKIEDLSS